VDPIHDAITFDRYSANVLIRADDNGSRTLLDVAETAEAWWAEHGAPDFEARTTGIMFEFARSEEAIAWGQIRGLSLALLAIGVILLVTFRDVMVAAIALVPNVASLSLIYGSMGFVGIPLDAGTVCMGTLALGIAVDDTIHVVSGYRLRRAAGASARSALAGTFDHVMPALVATSIAISAGFAALTLSGFLLTRNLGLVTAVVVAICLVADTTLLPAVLLRDADEAGDDGAQAP
jgi:predicted RND superfamily exporter protein